MKKHLSALYFFLIVVLTLTGCTTVKEEPRLEARCGIYKLDDETVERYNAIYPPVFTEPPDVILDNMAYGMPTNASIVIDRIGFANGYSHERRQPIWVSYRITPEEATNRVVKRTGDFRSDPLTAPSTVTPADYKRTGYDRGHIAPAADMAWDRTAMHNSFYMSNMSPQVPMFNRGIWRLLEEWVRETAAKDGPLFVYTGPIFAPNGEAHYINNIEVPIAYYKVILAEREPRKMIGFVLNNEPSDHSLSTFCCTVDEVESKTGVDFFSSLPQEVQDDLEGRVDLQLWRFQ